MKLTYSSALNSYINFCQLHLFEINPTEDTVSFFTVYMSYHIRPHSVASYLSGIQTQLEPFYPHIHAVCRSALVTKTLQGCKRLCHSEICRRQPLSPEDIEKAIQVCGSSHSHDDLLFVMQLVVGFAALHQLGELVWPDNVALQSFTTLPPRHKVEWEVRHFSYFLPGHKGDRTFQGNWIVIQQQLGGGIDPMALFRQYIQSRDSLFPGNPFLWVKSDGSIPLRSWFMG